MTAIRSAWDGLLTRVRPGALIAIGCGIAALVVVLVVVLTDGGPTRAEPEEAGLAKLRVAAEEAGFPVYWAGEMGGFQYELSRTKDGSVYVRYVPDGTPIGDQRPDFLTIGSYPVANAPAELRKEAKKVDAPLEHLGAKGLTYTDPANPTSVYLTFRDADFEIEVYDPDPARAAELVQGDQLFPIR